MPKYCTLDNDVCILPMNWNDRTFEPSEPGDGPQPGHLHERTFTCPHCWESISMLLDPSVQEQTYIEDCEVCCRPIRIHYAVQRGAVTQFSAQPTM